VVTPSDNARQQVIHRLGVPADRVRTVPHGIAPVGPPASADQILAVRQRHGLDGAKPFFLYPAITHPHKNHLLLVRAFARVAAQHPEVALVLTGGEGGAEVSIRSLIGSLDLSSRVRRLGRIPRADLDVLLQSAVALTFPSRFEGFGAPVLEAMAYGCPVIAADVTALPEVIGDAGVLVGPDDIEGWARAMLGLLADDHRRAELAAAGRARAEAFTWERAAGALAEAYRQALR
jgi:alpha-1,3-rhamnosyl/mannosyltransferase